MFSMAFSRWAVATTVVFLALSIFSVEAKREVGDIKSMIEDEADVQNLQWQLPDTKLKREQDADVQELQWQLPDMKLKREQDDRRLEHTKNFHDEEFSHNETEGDNSKGEIQATADRLPERTLLQQEVYPASSSSSMLGSNVETQAPASPRTEMQNKLGSDELWMKVQEAGSLLLGGDDSKSEEATKSAGGLALLSENGTATNLFQTPKSSLPVDSSAMRAERTRMYEAFGTVYQKLQDQGIPVFPRNGLLLAIVRDQGFMRWDYDTDMSILDIDVHLLKNADVSPYRLEIRGDGRANAGWSIKGDGLPWVVMDGVVWGVNDGRVNLHDWDEGLKENREVLKAGFDVNEWKRFVPAQFYCLTVQVPQGYKVYLTTMYGASWQTTAMNKCSRPDGSLYKVDPEHCNVAVYHGAMDLPVSPPLDAVRGDIDTKCPDLVKEQKVFEEEQKVSGHVSKGVWTDLTNARDLLHDTDIVRERERKKKAFGKDHRQLATALMTSFTTDHSNTIEQPHQHVGHGFMVACCVLIFLCLCVLGLLGLSLKSGSNIHAMAQSSQPSVPAMVLVNTLQTATPSPVKASSDAGVNNNSWKCSIFAAFVFLGCLQALTQHDARTLHYNYLCPVVVVSLLKIISSLVLFVCQDKGQVLSIPRILLAEYQVVLCYSVVAGMYCAYDVLRYINLSKFDPGTFVMVLQLRTVVTALIWELAFKKKLGYVQYLGLSLITVGCMIKMATGSFTLVSSTASIVPVLFQVIVNCGAVVANESLIKGQSTMMLNLQNIVQYSWTVVLCFLTGFLAPSGNKFSLNPFDTQQWAKMLDVRMLPSILVLTILGISTSWMLKYLNSMWKAIATSVELLLCSYSASFIFGYPVTCLDLLTIFVVTFGIGIYAEVFKYQPSSSS